MAKTILTGLQQTCLDWISNHSVLTDRFYLSGGTALAEFYLHHRLSEDLDFFSPEEFDPIFLEPYLEQLKKHTGAESLSLKTNFNRNLVYLNTKNETLKLEFCWFIGEPIEEGIKYHKLKIDSALDIAVNKIFTIYQRSRSRDYIDLFFLIRKYKLTIDALIKLARIKFDWDVDPIQLGAHLTKIDLSNWPNMILPIDESELRQFFESEAKKLESKIFKV